MKRVILRLGVALLTFGLGVGTAGSYRRVLRTPAHVTSQDVAADAAGPASSDPSSEAVTISLKRAYRSDGRIISAEFEVVNVSDGPVYYRGYSKDGNEFWSVRRGGKSQSYAPFCGTGLAERKLAPGGSAKFQASMGGEAGVAQVGFEFLVGEHRLRRTIWSKDVYIP
jgi:hypothetical protein